MPQINLHNDFLDEWFEKWFQYILDNPDNPWNYDLCKHPDKPGQKAFEMTVNQIETFNTRSKDVTFNE